MANYSSDNSKDFYRIVLFKNSFFENESEWISYSHYGIFFCLSGKCYFETQSIKFVLQHSQFAIISRDDMFRINNTKNDEYTCLLIVIKPSIQNFFIANNSNIGSEYFKEIKKTSIVDIVSESSQLVSIAIRRIYKDFKTSNLEESFYILTLICTVMHEIIPLYRTVNPALNNYAVNLEQIDQSRIVKKAIQYININYDQNINLNSIAQHFNVNPSYLSRQFKKKIGINVTDFISSKRVFSAKNLLISTDLNISEIAYSVGFQNIPYFNSVFKRNTELSPSSFRKKYKFSR